MPNVQLLPANSGFKVTLSRTCPARLPHGLESEIEAIWRAEQERRGAAIFNGNVISALAITPDEIPCRIVEYRHLLAQLIRPALYAQLQVTPLAVSGLLKCADGVVLGRRAASVTQQPGSWELVPSGGLHPDNAGADGEIDYRSQILAELQEEIGIGADAISSVNPICLLHDLDMHLLDIGIEMVSTLSAESVLRMHGATTSGEYAALRIVPPGGLNDFVMSRAGRIVGVSAKLIAHFLA